MLIFLGIRCLFPGVVLPPTHRLGASPQTLRVATFNVENYLDAATSTRRAKSPASEAKVRDSILALHPDVIALQEIGSSNALLQLDAALKASGFGSCPCWDQVRRNATQTFT